MEWIYNDGGRKEAGYEGKTRDCVCRAIAIATQKPYQEIYDLINAYAAKEHRRKRSSARTGVHKPTIRKVMAHLGWEWVPTMTIGSGCKVHLKDGQLPMGRLVVAVSKHETAVIDGVINDTYDCSRGGMRCVYGYFKQSDGGNGTKSPAITPCDGEQTHGGSIIPSNSNAPVAAHMAR